ncbi:protein kinase C substrate 80K-H [Entomortierella parvispora]|uniref:Glucosidase 2 subunit beta n=1 Tax=Entomortierella parvispora TaxID=205924 RepID=A0A9P3HBL3_9FUNG|nr:protein kinase C substrate 80K-H [Entomortierella parvispora]
MKTLVLFIPVVMALGLTFAEAESSQNRDIRGVAPSKLKNFIPDSNGNWRCLDGSKTIPFSAINDDYCDCPDGSDEPGTSACGTGYFYCVNKGHVPSYIKTNRLNDGVCDPQCCDGSDEFDGRIHCPNICDEVGAEAKVERQRLRKLQKEGSKIRKGYVEYGRNSKKRLQDQLEKLLAKSEVVQLKSSEAKAVLDNEKIKQDEFMESTKAEREAARRIQLEPIIAEQDKRLEHAKTIKSHFRSVMDELKEGHNKNYHDLAVKSTISGYDEYLAEIVEAEEEPASGEAVEITSDKQYKNSLAQTYETRKDIGRMFQLLKAMKEGYNTEYNDEAVLKALSALDSFAPSWVDEQNEFVGEESLVIPEAIPVETQESSGSGQDKSQTVFSSIYDQVRSRAKSVGLGFLFGKKKSDLELAQEAYNNASDEERRIQQEIEDVNRKMKVDYGKDESFAKLVDQCFEFKDREYTYSVCLFGNAAQKSDSSNTSLGSFSGWEGDDHRVQMYTGGLKCWNGPERSVKMVLSCGAVNEIISVTEPEKCEYLYNFKTPAVCEAVDETSEIQEDIDIIPEPTMPGETLTQDATKKHDEL